MKRANRSRRSPKSAKQKKGVSKNKLLIGGTAVLLAILAIAGYTGYQGYQKAQAAAHEEENEEDADTKADRLISECTEQHNSNDDDYIAIAKSVAAKQVDVVVTGKRSHADGAGEQKSQWIEGLGGCEEGLIVRGNQSKNIDGRRVVWQNNPQFYFKDVGGNGDCLYLCLLAAVETFDLERAGLHESRLLELLTKLNSLEIYNLKNELINLRPDEHSRCSQARRGVSSVADIADTPTTLEKEKKKSKPPTTPTPSLPALLKARYLRSLVVNSTELAVNREDDALKDAIQNKLKGGPTALLQLFEKIYPRSEPDGPEESAWDPREIRYMTFQLCIYDLLNSFDSIDYTPDGYKLAEHPGVKYDDFARNYLEDVGAGGDYNDDQAFLGAVRKEMLRSSFETLHLPGAFGIHYNIAAFESLADVNVILVQRETLPHDGEYNWYSLATLCEIKRTREEHHDRSSKAARPAILMTHHQEEHFQLAGLKVLDVARDQEPEIRPMFSADEQLLFYGKPSRIQDENDEGTEETTIYDFLLMDDPQC